MGRELVALVALSILGGGLVGLSAYEQFRGDGPLWRKIVGFLLSSHTFVGVLVLALVVLWIVF